jgi:hypothetical protein
MNGTVTTNIKFFEEETNDDIIDVKMQNIHGVCELPESYTFGILLINGTVYPNKGKDIQISSSYNAVKFIVTIVQSLSSSH